VRKTHLLSFWVDAKTYAGVSRLARDDGRSRSDILRRMVAKTVTEAVDSGQEPGEASPDPEVEAS